MKNLSKLLNVKATNGNNEILITPNTKNEIRAILNSDYKITEVNLPGSSILIKAKNSINEAVPVAILADSKDQKK